MVAPGAQDDEGRRLADARARVGTTLHGKWKLDGLLGLGGMAAVYSATHRNGIRGAVKVLDPIVARNEHMRERFLREGYLANSVNHTAAVLVIDDDTTPDGSVYLVMELLEGKTLEELATDSGGTLPLRELLDMTAQLLDALSHAHARGIVHRDIKPDNLFLTTSGTLKVLDFGIARLLESEMALSVTQTGSPMGTPAFMSPEQARGRAKMVDAQSDVYSVGATMFSLLSGELVHGSDITISEYVAAAFTNQARSLATVAPDVPAPIVAVVNRALRLDKTERWPSAAHMLEALGPAYAAIFGEELPPPPVPAPRSSRTSLVSLHEGRSLTPVSKRTPQSTPPRDSSSTLAPPPMAVSQALHAPSRGRWLAVGVALVVAACVALVVTRLAHESPRAPAATHETTIVQPLVESTATATVMTTNVGAAVTNALPNPVETQTAKSKPLAIAKTTAKPAPSAVPSASSAQPAASAPPVNVYDRRY